MTTPKQRAFTFTVREVAPGMWSADTPPEMGETNYLHGGGATVADALRELATDLERRAVFEWQDRVLAPGAVKA